MSEGGEQLVMEHNVVLGKTCAPTRHQTSSEDTYKKKITCLEFNLWWICQFDTYSSQNMLFISLGSASKQEQLCRNGCLVGYMEEQNTTSLLLPSPPPWRLITYMGSMMCIVYGKSKFVPFFSPSLSLRSVIWEIKLIIYVLKINMFSNMYILEGKKSQTVFLFPD